MWTLINNHKKYVMSKWIQVQNKTLAYEYHWSHDSQKLETIKYNSLPYTIIRKVQPNCTINKDTVASTWMQGGGNFSLAHKNWIDFYLVSGVLL